MYHSHVLSRTLRVGNMQGCETLTRQAVLFVVTMLLSFLSAGQAFADDTDKIYINETNFPDAVFRDYVLNTLCDSYIQDRETNPYITTTDAEKITEIKQQGDFESVVGIEYFTKITSLNLSSTKLTKIDLRANTLLQTVYLQDNDSLKTVYLEGLDKLTRLNLANDTIRTLDLSTNTALTYADLRSNGLTSVTLTGLTSLATLYLQENSLTAVSLEGLSSLATAYLNDNNLTSVNFGELSSLTKLYLQNNNLTSIDLSGLGSLTSLNLSYNSLATIDVSDNGSLTTFKVEHNCLKSIDLSALTSLTSSSIDNQADTLNIYMDGSKAYALVPEGLDLTKVSDAVLVLRNSNDETETATDANLVSSSDLTFTLGSTADENGMVPLYFLDNVNTRKRLFHYANNKVIKADVFYYYKTAYGSSGKSKKMGVSIYTTCYLLPTITATSGSDGTRYASVNLPYAAEIPAGATAYSVTAVSDNTVTLTEIASEGETVPAQTPMVITSTDEANTILPLNLSAATPVTVEGNLLSGTLGSTVTASDQYWVLGTNNETGEVGFWHTSYSSIGAWRAYLDANNLNASSAKSAGFSFGPDNTTGITGITNSGNTADGAWYTLSGTRLSGKPAQRGVYIHNGKKVIVTGNTAK